MSVETKTCPWEIGLKQLWESKPNNWARISILHRRVFDRQFIIRLNSYPTSFVIPKKPIKHISNMSVHLNKPEELPPRPITTFRLFKSDLYQRFRNENRDMGIEEFCRVAAEQWRASSKDIKQSYIDRLNSYNRQL